MFKSLRRNIKSCIPATLILVVTLASCGKELPTFHGLDMGRWQQDKNACGTYRAASLDAFKSQKEKLLALKEMQVVELLGRPDKNELYKRNQKFYYYYLKPSPDCEKYSPEDNSRLAIRFNAMGLAKEVIIE